MGKLRLLNDDNSEVDLNSAAAINARHATLSAQCQSYTETVYGWSKAWHRDKLVEERSQIEINKHAIIGNRGQQAITLWNTHAPTTLPIFFFY